MLLNYTPLFNYSVNEPALPLRFYFQKIVSYFFGLVASKAPKKASSISPEIKIIETADGIIFLDTEITKEPVFTKILAFAKSGLLKVFINAKKIDQSAGKIINQVLNKVKSFRPRVTQQQKQQAFSFVVGLLILMIFTTGSYSAYQKIKNWQFRITPTIFLSKIPKLALPKMKLPLAIPKSSPAVWPTPTIELKKPVANLARTIITSNKPGNYFPELNNNLTTVIQTKSQTTVSETTLFYKPAFLEKAKAIAASLHQNVYLIEGDGFPNNADFFLVSP